MQLLTTFLPPVPYNRCIPPWHTVTCYTHMISRVCVKLSDSYPEVNAIVKNVKKIFEKCPIRRSEWTKFNNRNRENFPAPVPTRVGTWLNAVTYICTHWADLKDFLKAIPGNEIAAAKKSLDSMNVDVGKQLVIFCHSITTRCRTRIYLSCI